MLGFHKKLHIENNNRHITYIKNAGYLQPYSVEKVNGNYIEDWTNDKKINLSALKFGAAKCGNKLKIRIFPRRMVKTVWNHEKPDTPWLNKEYAFRAFARGSKISLFDDDTETSESLIWLLFHEIAHVCVSRTPKLRNHFRTMKKPQGYLTSDAAHESSPEEQFANMMANQWFKEFYGKSKSYHRLWWRKQVQKK